MLLSNQLRFSTDSQEGLNWISSLYNLTYTLRNRFSHFSIILSETHCILNILYIFWSAMVQPVIIVKLINNCLVFWMVSVDFLFCLFVYSVSMLTFIFAIRGTYSSFWRNWRRKRKKLWYALQGEGLLFSSYFQTYIYFVL